MFGAGPDVRRGTTSARMEDGSTDRRALGMRSVRRVTRLLGVGALAISAVPLGSGLSSPRLAAMYAQPALVCQSHWITDWFAAPTDATLSLAPVDQTYRIQVRPLHGGTVARFRLSNRFGHGPVTFGSATVGTQYKAGSPAVTVGSLHQLLFRGRRSVTVPEGADVYSDPVRMTFSAFRHLLVSLDVDGSPGPATQHGLGEQTTWTTLPGSGDHTRQAGPNGFIGFPIKGLVPALPQSIPYLAGMESVASSGVGTVVAFGDSITDGAESTLVPDLMSTANIDQFASYPDQLANRLAAAGASLSVANAGISGNQLLHNGPLPIFGASGLSRIGRDALSLPGATTLIILEGINDIGMSTERADDIIAGYKLVVSAAHRRGIRALLGTLTPQNGVLQPGYGFVAEETRMAVNRWIRNQHVSDGIIDFDRAVRDPVDPSRIRPAYDGGDHLHFNTAGYAAMASVVPLSLLRSPRCG